MYRLMIEVLIKKNSTRRFNFSCSKTANDLFVSRVEYLQEQKGG